MPSRLQHGLRPISRFRYLRSIHMLPRGSWVRLRGARGGAERNETKPTKASQTTARFPRGLSRRPLPEETLSTFTPQAQHFHSPPRTNDPLDDFGLFMNGCAHGELWFMDYGPRSPPAVACLECDPPRFWRVMRVPESWLEMRSGKDGSQQSSAPAGRPAGGSGEPLRETPVPANPGPSAISRDATPSSTDRGSFWGGACKTCGATVRLSFDPKMDVERLDRNPTFWCRTCYAKRLR